MAAIARIAVDGSLHGHRADFVDGTAFGLDEIYLTVGAYLWAWHLAPADDVSPRG